MVWMCVKVHVKFVKMCKGFKGCADIAKDAKNAEMWSKGFSEEINKINEIWRICIWWNVQKIWIWCTGVVTSHQRMPNIPVTAWLRHSLSILIQSPSVTHHCYPPFLITLKLTLPGIPITLWCVRSHMQISQMDRKEWSHIGAPSHYRIVRWHVQDMFQLYKKISNSFLCFF
jgi:hypothetical protein